MILFGPVGVVGGAFVKGSSVTIPAGTNTYVQVAEDTSVDGVILAGSAVAGQQLDGNTQEGGPQTAQPASAVTKEPAGETAAEPAAEAQKEPAAAPQPKKNTGVALDETEPEAAQPADDSQTVQEPAAKTGEDKADAETEAALAEAQKRDEEAKKLAKKDSSSQPMLDEDDGSAYDTATL